MGIVALQKWLFYDTLLSLIPPQAVVVNCVAGRYWYLVETNEGGIGLSHLLKQDAPSTVPKPLDIIGRPLSEVAALVKSWDIPSAALGLAAINAAANARHKELIEAGIGSKARQGCAFDFFLERLRGKKVAVVGHFPNLEKIAEVADLVILERHPQPGDLPDPAAEYILEERDAVFLTGTTIINKTLPRLLELSQGKEVFLVGPSAPMFPELFKFGFASLSGTLIANPPAMAAAVAGDLSEEIFHHGGLMINLLRENYL
jgi:uncharacterized protein (DUF4213/DUF364 family)